MLEVLGITTKIFQGVISFKERYILFAPLADVYLSQAIQG